MKSTKVKESWNSINTSFAIPQGSNITESTSHS
jgi:hypothetical protein